MKKRKVIIDCDPGIDDSLAIMLALKSPEIEVIGITIVCGNSPVEMGFGNAKKILKQMNRLDVPVYIGESTPLRRDYVNALDTHGEDGLGESFLPEVIGYQQQISAVDFLADVLKKEKVSIIELAPMTNLARLIQKDKEAFSCIEEIVSMGGSFKSHGNCSPVAEYNYWCDPDGASLVYETLHQNGQKIHMVGLDVTRKIVLTPDLLEYMCRLNKETGEFVKKITKFYFDFHWEWEHIIGCVINDPLAVAYFINPELCKGFDSYVQIETEGISLGQSVVDSMNFYRKASNARVLTEVDVYGFFQMFLSRILDQEPEKLDILQDLIRGWNAAQSAQRPADGNDCRYLFPVLCSGRNSSWFCDRSCVQKIPAEKVADISGCSCDHTSIYHNQFLYYGIFIWRNHFFRIHCSCTASGKNTSGNGRKLFCSSVYHRLH